MSAKGPNRFITPSSLLLRGFVLVLLCWYCGWWLWDLGAGTRSDRQVPSVPAAIAQLKVIKARLAAGEGASMDQLFPEGKIFSYSFYGFTWINLATSHREEVELDQTARMELERILPIVEACTNEPQYRGNENLPVRGGIIPAGMANLLRAGYVLIGGKHSDILDKFHESSAALQREFMKTTVGSLETSSASIWPVDNCAALESLRLHDVSFGTKYSNAGDRWVEWMGAHLDTSTGMMVAQIDVDGTVVDPPRGCALSWSLAMMPGFAPELARTQYERYRREWFMHPWGTTGVREWPVGHTGVMNADTGPVVFGIGAAASGLAIAAAKANGDEENLTGLLRGLELMGLPSRNLRGEKVYFFRQVVLADIFAIWGRTIHLWDRPPIHEPTLKASPPGFWKAFTVSTALCIAFVGLLGRSFVRAMRRFRKGFGRWQSVHKIALGLNLVIIAWWVFALGWAWAIVVMAAITGLEHRWHSDQKRRSTPT